MSFVFQDVVRRRSSQGTLARQFPYAILDGASRSTALGARPERRLLACAP
ncbi:MAG: hypothetical protein K1X74_05200 [Pirellulales bacterium]|nr:hypothetical protein [Pirellulales bacterium]